MELRVALCVIVLLVSISVTPAFAHNVQAVFIFGDSLFDAGNNHYNKNCSAQADFPPYGSTYFHHPTGRFTNGRTVADFISQFLGIGIQKPFLEAQLEVVNGSRKEYPSNGINFASAGSGLYRATNSDLVSDLPVNNSINFASAHFVSTDILYRDQGVTPIQDQLQQFQALMDQKLVDRKLVEKSLFFFESGSNDVFNYFLPFDTPTLTPDAYVQTMLTEVEHFVDQIYKLGARRIALFSLGPVGCVPARTLIPATPVNRCFGKMNIMAKNYNKGVENIAKNIPKKYPGSVGVYGSVYSIFQLYRTTPSTHGITNVTDACCGDGTLRGMLQCGQEGYKVCDNPNEYLFWDYFHPSEHTYKLMSKSLWAGNKFIHPMNLKTLANLTIT